MSTCPVCQHIATPQQTQCTRCGWQFRYFLNITDTEANRYQTDLRHAQQAWQTRQTNEKTTEKIPEPTETQTKTTNTTSFNFKRDIFETLAEFKQRIENTNPYPIGQATLLLSHYQVETGYFPLQIVWQNLPQRLTNKGFYLQVDRETAKTLYAENTTHNIQAILQVRQEQVFIQFLQLQGLNKTFPIYQQEEEQLWEWAKNTHSPQSYQQYLLSDNLKNHEKEAWIYLEKSLKQMHTKELYILIGIILITALGAGIGTVIGVATIGGLTHSIIGAFIGALCSTGTTLLLIFIFTTHRYLGENALFALDSANNEPVFTQQIALNLKQTQLITLRGWAIDEIAQRAAGGVYLILDDTQPILAMYGCERMDVIKNFQKEDYRYSGFMVSLDCTKLTRGNHILSLKILNADKTGYYLPSLRFMLMIN